MNDKTTIPEDEQSVALDLYPGAECWREYFDCGTTPADALTEDESYA
jgi:hypothetical protein